MTQPFHLAWFLQGSGAQAWGEPWTGHIGTTWQKPALSVEDSWDVAAFVESHERPHKLNLERDFPNRLQKPVDAPYGPYADNFELSQHKLGPFQPIREAIKALAGRSSTQQQAGQKP